MRRRAGRRASERVVRYATEQARGPLRVSVPIDAGRPTQAQPPYLLLGVVAAPCVALEMRHEALRCGDPLEPLGIRVAPAAAAGRLDR